MRTEREIPKDVPAPALCLEAVQLLTDVCFLPEEEVAKETVFGQYGEVIIFGTSHPTSHQQIVDKLIELRLDGYRPNTVYITGGETTPGKVESEEIFARINELQCGFARYSGVEFKLDCNSRSTQRNVESAIKLGLGSVKTGIIFIAKSGHCGRCKLTLDRYFPKTDIQAWGYNPILSDDFPPISRTNWFQNSQICDKVWAEFLRIERYGLRGDIAYPAGVRQKVERVRALTKA